MKPAETSDHGPWTKIAELKGQIHTVGEDQLSDWTQRTVKRHAKNSISTMAPLQMRLSRLPLGLRALHCWALDPAARLT